MEEDGTPPSTTTSKNSDLDNTLINQIHIQTPNITNTQKKTDTEMEMEIDVIPETQLAHETLLQRHA